LIDLHYNSEVILLIMPVFLFVLLTKFLNQLL